MKHESYQERQERIRKGWPDDPRIAKLIDSGALASVIEMLREKRRVLPFESERTPLDFWVVGAVRAALAPPDVAETMTASERAKLAKTIADSARQLSASLGVFQSDHGMRWPFQPGLDRLALNVAISEEERLGAAGVPMDEDTSHRCRYAVYHLLMDHLNELFETLIEGAEWFGSSETLLKRPNDKNADRLYFIRTLNRAFCREFRSPCRTAALAITSVYFDCGDLDEAALSKLAPFYKPTPIEAPPETVDWMKEYHANQGDPTYMERFLAHLDAESKWGMGRDSSAE